MLQSYFRNSSQARVFFMVLLSWQAKEMVAIFADPIYVFTLCSMITVLLWLITLTLIWRFWIPLRKCWIFCKKSIPGTVQLTASQSKHFMFCQPDLNEGIFFWSNRLFVSGLSNLQVHLYAINNLAILNSLSKFQILRCHYYYYLTDIILLFGVMRYIIHTAA